VKKKLNPLSLKPPTLVGCPRSLDIKIGNTISA